MPTQKKIAAVKELKDKFDRATAVFFTEYHGLSVNDLNELRGNLRATNAELVITKNTLLGVSHQQVHLSGPTATLFTYADPMTSLRVVRDFQKKFKLPSYKSGLFGKKLIDSETITELATLPNQEQLIGQLLGLLNTPLSNLVRIMSINQINLVYALSEMAKKSVK